MRKLLFAAFFFMLAALPAMASEPPREIKDPAEALVNGEIVVKGEGASPTGPFTQAQKRIMALRAAKTVALREAAEVLDGVTVSGETTIEKAAAKSDIVRTAAQGLITGATVVKEDYDDAAGTAVIFISVPMHWAAATLMPSVSGLVGDMPQYRPGLMASTLGYDGLIVDARGRSLKPALINRILSKNGEVIYDPSKLGSEVLSSGGSALFTSDIARAKELLSKKGSAKPLIVKAESVSRSTDAELGPIEAGAVFYSNQMTNFLKAARVVFVLD